MEPQRSRIRPIDVLVIVAILLVLGSLMLPAVVSVGHVNREVRCEGNLRALGTALLGYREVHRIYPPGIVSDVPPGNRRRDGWLLYDHHRELVEYVAKGVRCYNAEMAGASGLSLLLPFIGENATHNAYNFSVACCAIQNATAVSARINNYVCPINPVASAPGASWGYYQAPPAFGLIGPGTTDYVFSLGATGLITENHHPYYKNWSGGVEGWPGINGRAAGAFNVNLGLRRTGFGEKDPKLRDEPSKTFAMGEAVSGLPMGLATDGRPAKGNEPINVADKSFVVRTPWSQGFIGWRPSFRDGRFIGNHGGFGSVFATTAWNAWYKMPNADLAPSEKWFPIPPNEGGGAMARPTWYRESSPCKSIRMLVEDGSGIPGDIGSLQGFRSLHSTVPMLFMDGSVRQIKPTIDLKIWVGLSTVEGREPIPDDF